MNDLNRIRKRHPEIPQEPLPGFDTPTPTTGGGKAVKRNRSPKSVEFARCPHHVPGHGAQGGLTGLIRAGNHLIFRDHYKRIGNTTVLCPGSGTTPTSEHSESENPS